LVEAVLEQPLPYVVGWSTFCLLAVLIVLVDRQRLRQEWAGYLKFMAVPWKLVIFIPTLIFVTLAGHFTDDETWDVVVGSGMAIFTFATSPLSVGLVYQVCTGRKGIRYLIVAAALGLFSASWFYDGYLLWRDGQYTSRWLGNLCLSPLAYTAGGILWNLESDARGRYWLAFLRPDWPHPSPQRRTCPPLYLLVPPTLVAAYILLGFVRWHW
jgi:hypothetical protein